MLVLREGAADYLRADDFAGFHQARKAALLSLIESVMGKAVLAMLHADAADDDAVDETGDEPG